MQKENIKKFKKYVVQQNLKKKPEILDYQKKKGGTIESCFEKIEKQKIKAHRETILWEEIKTGKVEKLAGIEISLAGRIKGAAMARRTTTGLSGSLKPQTILGSEYYSITQKNVFTKWGILGLTIRTNNHVAS